MDDLIARLRSIPKEVLVTRFDGVPTECGKWAHEAADEIERLRFVLDYAAPTGWIAAAEAEWEERSVHSASEGQK